MRMAHVVWKRYGNTHELYGMRMVVRYLHVGGMGAETGWDARVREGACGMIRGGVRDAEICDTRKCVMRKCVGSRRAFGGSGKRWSSGGAGWYPLGPVHTVDNALNT